MVGTRNKGEYPSPSKVAKKVRNKVASPYVKAEEATYSSDEFAYKEHEDDLSVSGSGASVSSSVSKRKREKISAHILKQLAIDIQGAGGIGAFKLSAPQALSVLCDKNQELYGSRGDTFRQRLRKKVGYWREKFDEDETTWIRTLEDLGVLEKPKGLRGLEVKVPTKKTKRRSAGKNTEESEEDKKPAAVDKTDETVYANQFIDQTPASKPTQVSIPFARAPVPATTKSAANMSTLENTIAIQVSLTRPECNGPFLIYSVPAFKGTGQHKNKEFKGYYILLNVDRRFELLDQTANFHSAKVIGAKKILVKMPAFPFAMFPQGEQSRPLYNHVVSQVDNEIKKSMNDAHSVWDNTTDQSLVEHRKWTYWLLDFEKVDPHGELSAKVVSQEEEGDDDELDYDLLDVPAEWSVEADGTWRTTREETFYGFKVASVEADGGRKVARTATKLSKAQEKRNRRKSEMHSEGLVVPLATTSSLLPVEVPSTMVPSNRVGFVVNAPSTFFNEERMREQMIAHTETDDMSQTDLEAERCAGSRDDDGMLNRIDGLVEDLSADVERTGMDTDNNKKRSRGQSSAPPGVQGKLDFGSKLTDFLKR